jgi:hypothetical protein
LSDVAKALSLSETLIKIVGPSASTQSAQARLLITR